MAQVQFKGKMFVQNHHLLVKFHELFPGKAERRGQQDLERWMARRFIFD